MSEAAPDEPEAPEPRCFECLTADVAVRVIDQFGFEHWFCAADWQANQDFHARLMALLEDAISARTGDGAPVTP